MVLLGSAFIHRSRVSLGAAYSVPWPCSAGSLPPTASMASRRGASTAAVSLFEGHLGMVDVNAVVEDKILMVDLCESRRAKDFWSFLAKPRPRMTKKVV